MSNIKLTTYWGGKKLEFDKGLLELVIVLVVWKLPAPAINRSFKLLPNVIGL